MEKHSKYCYSGSKNRNQTKGVQMKTSATKVIAILFLSAIFLTNMPNIHTRRLKKMKHFYHNLPVLVTGGAGFIGSHLVEKLVELGAKVTVIDDLSSGSIQNLDRVLYKITFMQKSITDMNACLEATKDKAVIFHLAAFISVPDSIKKPQLCHQINVDGTFNILEAARINNVERFVFSSSAAVYGPAEHICKEDISCNPQSPYGTSKLVGELLCKQYADNFRLKTACLRYFNVFGDRQNPNGAYAAVVAKFKHLMKQNLPLTIFGDGLQTRDFIPVEKVAEANLTIAMLDEIHGDIYNVGTGRSINLLQLVDLLKEEIPDYTGKITFAPARAGDIKHSSADCSKYKNVEI